MNNDDAFDPSATLVSIIVLNYNGRHFLEKCLGSLETQTYRNFETWLVDNGSSDHSVEFVRRSFAWVRIMPLEHNLGFCAGNNAAILASRGKYVALLNNDTIVDPAWLEELVKAIETDPKAGICASRILSLHEPSVLYAAGDCYSVSGVAYRRGERMRAAGHFEQSEEVFTACACAALYRRNMLEEIGLFDEDFFSNCEDVDLGFRARLAGYTCLYVPKSVVYHVGSGTAGVRNPRVEFLSSRNSEHVFFKNMPFVLILRYLPLHLLQICWAFFRRLREGLLWPYMKGKIIFLADFRRVLAKRRMVQSHRKASLSQLTSLMDKRPLARFIQKVFARPIPE
jgi:GT2 family glycosyltransferase